MSGFFVLNESSEKRPTYKFDRTCRLISEVSCLIKKNHDFPAGCEGKRLNVLVSDDYYKSIISNRTGSLHLLKYKGISGVFSYEEADSRSIKVYKSFDVGRVEQHLAGGEVGKYRPVGAEIIKSDMRVQHLYHFLKEALILSCIDHPNIVKLSVLELFCNEVLQSVHLHLCMDYAGPPLSSVIASGKWSGIMEPDLPVIVKQILLAMDYLSSAFLSHMDIKPSNIVVTVLDGSIRVRLIDFELAENKIGLRCCFSDYRYRAYEDFHTSSRVGDKCSYGRVEVRDNGASDIFAFGITLYELILNKIPHKKPYYNGCLGSYVRRGIYGQDFFYIPAEKLDTELSLNNKAISEKNCLFPSIIQKCTMLNPKKRSSASALLCEFTDVTDKAHGDRLVKIERDITESLREKISTF